MKVVMNVLSVVTEFLLSETKNLPHQEIVVTTKKKRAKKKGGQIVKCFSLLNPFLEMCCLKWNLEYGCWEFFETVFVLSNCLL